MCSLYNGILFAPPTNKIVLSDASKVYGIHCCKCKKPVVEFGERTFIQDWTLFSVDAAGSLRDSEGPVSDLEDEMDKELRDHGDVCEIGGREREFSFYFEPIEIENVHVQANITICSSCHKKIKEEHFIDGYDICYQCLAYNRDSRRFLKGRVEKRTSRLRSSKKS